MAHGTLGIVTSYVFTCKCDAEALSKTACSSPNLMHFPHVLHVNMKLWCYTNKGSKQKYSNFLFGSDVLTK